MGAQPAQDATAGGPPGVLGAAPGAPGTGDRPGRADRHPQHPPPTVLVAGGARQGRTVMVEALRRATSAPAPTMIVRSDDATDGTNDGTVDVVVLVAAADHVLGDAELDRLRALRLRSHHTVLALTEIDRHPRWRDVLDADLALMRSAGVPAAPMAVSLDLYTQAAGVPALVGASGLPALVERLHEFAAQAPPPAVRRQEPVDAPPSAPPRRPPGDEPGRTVPDRGRWQQILSDGIAAASSDVDFDLRTRVRATVAEAERAVDETDPTHQWGALEAWLRARLDHDAEQTSTLLAQRVGAIADALATHLGGGPLRLPPPAAPDLFGHLPQRDAPTGTGRPLAARGRTLVMSSYGGVMMALILPRFAGVDLPVWLILTGALLAAALMGGAALSGERKRQLDARRTRAKALVRHSADGFLLGAGKHTRDALRAAQQQLRDECAARTAVTARQQPTPVFRLMDT